MQASIPTKTIPFTTHLINFITKWGSVLTIVVLIIFFTISMPNSFMTTSNLTTILRSISIVTVIAIGVTVSLTINGFDLSVGSMATFADTLVISMFVWYMLPTVPAILVTIAVALIIGLVNAFLVVKIKIPDLLVTLSMLFILEGVAMTYAGGGSISQGMPRLDGTPTFGTLPSSFRLIGQAPYIIIIMLVVVAAVHIFLITPNTAAIYMLSAAIWKLHVSLVSRLIAIVPWRISYPLPWRLWVGSCSPHVSVLRKSMRVLVT